MLLYSLDHGNSMKRAAHIIPRTFTAIEQLEQQARHLLSGKQKVSYVSSHVSLEQEIDVTLDHLTKVRELHQELRQSLLREECYVDTELMQMEQRTPRYSPHRFPEREKLQRRLGAIGKERRHLALLRLDKLEVLQTRLLTLLNKHSHLAPSQKGEHR